jgi:hypothetical protein
MGSFLFLLVLLTGRDDRRRQHPQSLKDVWVYELSPKARAQLQACTVEVLAPRSVFAPAGTADWAEEEMAGVALGDQRLNERAQRMLRHRWARPANSFYRSFGSAPEAKGAYQLVENPRYEINLASLLAPQQQKTARRMAAESVVLLDQDTTALSYNSLRQGRPARTATLELRWQEVELQPPAVALKKSWPPLKVYEVWAREVGARARRGPMRSTHG